VVLAGSVIWGTGISPGQRVYTTADPQARLAILEKTGWRWTAGQYLAALGTAIVPAGFAGLAAAMPPGSARKMAGAAAGSLVVGAPFFIWCLVDRANDLERFAFRRGPAWPFLLYSWLHIGGLAFLSGSLAAMPESRRAAMATGTATPVFAAWLAARRDIPPFVFYLAEMGVAAALLRRRAPSGSP
jgi:hypothetical protein